MSDGSFLTPFLGEITQAPQNNTIAEAYRIREAQMNAIALRRRRIIWVIIGVAMAIAIVFLIKWLRSRRAQQELIEVIEVD